MWVENGVQPSSPWRIHEIQQFAPAQLTTDVSVEALKETTLHGKVKAILIPATRMHSRYAGYFWINTRWEHLETGQGVSKSRKMNTRNADHTQKNWAGCWPGSEAGVEEQLKPEWTACFGGQDVGKRTDNCVVPGEHGLGN